MFHPEHIISGIIATVVVGLAALLELLPHPAVAPVVWLISYFISLAYFILKYMVAKYTIAAWRQKRAWRRSISKALEEEAHKKQ